MIPPDLLARLHAIVDFPDALQTLHDAHYTGPITFHFYLGQPQTLEVPPPSLPPPVQVRFGRKARRGLTAPVPVPHSIA